MEIYRNSAAETTVTLDLPAGIMPSLTAVDIVALERGRDVFTFGTVAATANGLSVTLPWHLTNRDRDLIIDWTITYNPGNGNIVVKDRSYVQVVTPILPLDHIAEIANINLTTERNDVEDLERRVRYTIQSYTGQNFGKFFGVMRVTGNGSKKLALPAPLLEFGGMSFDGVYRPQWGMKIVNNGWGLSTGSIYIDNIKQAPPEWMLDLFQYDGKIRAPMLYGENTFLSGVEYSIEGLWGYNDIPGDVKQAARLLVQDYACDESLWRDRYIQSMQAADWRLQFNPQAFTGTGNVQADQILSGYRRQTMVVV